jgi:DNA polymerase III delta subunit
MELAQLMTRISSGSIPHFLILFGEEQTILDIYIQHIAQAVEGKIIPAQKVSNAVKQVGKKSLDKSRKIYTITDDPDFIKNEEIWKIVKSYFKKDYVILRYHSLDKRSAFVKKNQQNIVEFSHLSDEVLQQYIQRDLPDLSDENSRKLISYCHNDYGRILMEIDKIWQAQSSRLSNFNINLDSNDCFDQLDKQGLFHKEIGDITFELTDAVLGGYPDLAIKKLEEANRKGEPAMMIASILYNGFRNLLAYQGLGNNKNGAMERTGLTKGELWGCNKNIGGYSLSELRRNMLFCQKVEAGIKMGKVDEDIALDYLVLTCLK